MRTLLPVIAASLFFTSLFFISHAHAAESSGWGNGSAARSGPVGGAGAGSSFGLDMSFSDESANLEALVPVRRFTRGRTGGQLESNGLFSLGVFYNELDDVIGHAKLIAVGNQTGTRVPYQLEFGVKAYAGKVKQDSTDIGALAIGGGIKIQNPFTRKGSQRVGYNPIDLKIEGFFTPGITTFGDTDSMLEITARLSLEIVPAAQAFVGYRLLEVENQDHVTLELDDNVHLGFRLLF